MTDYILFWLTKALVDFVMVVVITLALILLMLIAAIVEWRKK